MKPAFVAIEHTADVGIIANGKTLSELFENAAAGMYSFLADTTKIKGKITEKVSAGGVDNESLLVNWLNELVYLTQLKKIIFSVFKIEKYDEFSLRGWASGDTFNPKVNPPDTEIKAATYHGLKIKKNAEGFSACIIFDV